MRASLAQALRPILVATLALSGLACASSAKTPPSGDTGVRMAPPDAPPPSDGMPAGFTAGFAAADSRARAVTFWQQCASNVIRLRASGTFGPAARAPREVYCERTDDGLPLGGVFEIDTAYTRVRRLMMVRLDGARPRHTAPVDTARIASISKLARDASRDIASAWRRLGRPYSVVPVVQDGRAEAWVIPISPRGGNTAITGGDIGYLRGGDGKLQRATDRSGSWTLATIPAAGQVKLISKENLVPGVAEIALARGLAERGRDVSISTAATTSTLVQGVDPATGSRIRWEHTRK